MRFRLAGRNDEMKDACLSVILTPDQVEGDIKDTVYQTTGIAHAVIPDPRSGRGVTLRIRFIKLRESFTPSFPTPDQVGG